MLIAFKVLEPGEIFRHKGRRYQKTRLPRRNAILLNPSADSSDDILIFFDNNQFVEQNCEN